MPTESTGTLDMTLSSTSGRHLSKFQKTAVRRFTCPTNWWASCSACCHELRRLSSFFVPYEVSQSYISKNGLTSNHSVFNGHSERPLPQPRRVCATSGRELSRKNIENAASDGIGLNFSGMV